MSSPKTNQNEETAALFGWVVIFGVIGVGLYLGYQKIQEVLVLPDVTHLLESILKWGTISLVIACVGWIALLVYQQSYARKAARWMEIIPHVNTEFSEERIKSMVGAFYENKRGFFLRLLRGSETFELRFVGKEGEHEKGSIRIFIGFPQDKHSHVPQTIKNCYPDCDLLPVDRDQIPIPFLNSGFGGLLSYQNSSLPGLSFAQLEKDEAKDILSHMRPGTFYSINFRPASNKALERVLEKTHKRLIKGGGAFSFLQKILTLFSGDRAQELAGAYKSLDTSTTETLLRELKTRVTSGPRPFYVDVQVWSEDDQRETVRSLQNSINGAVRHTNAIYLRTRRKSTLSDVPNVPKRMIWTSKELATLVHLPKGRQVNEEISEQKRKDHIFDRIPHIIAGQSRIKPHEFASGATLGTYVYPGDKKRLIHLIPEKMRKMMLVLGSTGSGKTALFFTMLRKYFLPKFVEQDSSFGGLTFIDPKGTGAKAATTYFHELSAQSITFDHEKVHYFDVLDPEFVPGINLLDTLPGQTEEDVVKAALNIMQSTFPNQSIWFEKYGRLAMKALLRDKEEKHTILSLAPFLREKSPLRNRITFQLLTSSNIMDQDLARQILEVEEKKKFGGNEIEPFLNRLTRLKDNPVTVRVFGQRKTTINPLQYMQEGHITFLNTAGLDKIENKLVTGYIAELYHFYCYKRNNTQSNHYLIVDEAHSCQFPIMHEEIIPKDREAGLILVLMTQALHQFEEELKDAITDIGGNIISFALGNKSARAVETITTKTFKASDIYFMKQLRAAALTENAKGEKTSFIFDTSPPYIFAKDGTQTYYGPDDLRIKKEKDEALRNARNQFTKKWMSRDCLSIDQIQNEVEEQLKNTWLREFDLKSALNENKDAERFMKFLLEDKSKNSTRKKATSEVDEGKEVNYDDLL